MTERHFRVVQLDGKKVEFGGVSITSKASPGSAARKLLTSIAHEKGLKKNKKASMPKVKFCIQEYTQGSSKKVYGPYVGHFHKYTAAELKKASTAKGKIKFTMKPVVKLAKGNMKGGLFNSCKYQGNPGSEKYVNCEIKKGLEGVNKKVLLGSKKYNALSNRAMTHLNKGLNSPNQLTNKHIENIIKVSNKLSESQLNKVLKSGRLKADQKILLRIEKINKLYKNKFTLKIDENKDLHFEIDVKLASKKKLESINNNSNNIVGNKTHECLTKILNILEDTHDYKVFENKYSGKDQYNLYELVKFDYSEKDKIFYHIIHAQTRKNLTFEDLVVQAKNNESTFKNQ